MSKPNLIEVQNVGEYMSTRQVSKALGVSITTVKRWVDDGILPAHRTAGGHRKLLWSDVNRLARAGNLPQAHLNESATFTKRADRKNADHYARLLVGAVETDDAERIRGLIVEAYRAGITVDSLADRMIGPVFHHIGHQWSEGRIDVVREHHVTQAALSALFELADGMQANARADRPVAIGGAPEHDHYLLPSMLARLMLLECGWNAINLGPHTPMTAFRNALDEYQPRLVWLSFSMAVETDAFIDEYREFYAMAESRGIAVAIGGQGLSESTRSRLPYTTYGDGMTQLASFARTLYRPPTRPKRGRPVKHG
jgi:excisionase family DNA binding protein